MAAERWQRAEELFHAARERSPDERAAFLDANCDGDDELRRNVEVLLKHHGERPDFIASPAFAVTPELLVADPDALLGQHLGPFRIESVLGVGGMGVVYLALDKRLGRKVGLKLLPHAVVQNETQLARLKREARTASALNHPNIVTIHEIGEVGGTHYIATEFVEGTTLRERIARGPLPKEEALEIFRQIARALAVAHEAGIVHRDIKPENIMLRRDGLVKVLDFGLAKLAATGGGEALPRTTFTTSPGLLMGTVAYMSPEQARGLELDARTDIWSLGAVLYEMITGKQPFTGPTPTDVIISIAEREPVPLNSDAPPQFRRAVQKALAKRPQDRYETAKDLLADLKSGEVIETRARGPARRRVLIAAAILVAGMIAAFFFRQTSPPATAPEIKSLAVLPLENLSGDAAQDYFADGMTDALITELAKISGLRVISRPSVVPYKAARKPLPEVGRELNVDALLTGSVVRAGERVRIAVQLTGATSEQHVWAESYERDLRDVLILQREVTRDIANQIRIKLSPQEQMRFGNTRPVNPEAYDHYLRAQFYLDRQNKTDNEVAISALERAVAIDPNFAAAQAALAQAYVWRLFLFTPNEGQWAEKAYVAVEKALSLDPNLALAHLARGRLLWTPANRFPHEKAIREYRRALALNPNLDEARNQLALVYNHIGAFEESLAELHRAVAINPSNSLAQFRIGETLLFQGKHEEALRTLRSVPRAANPALVGHLIAWAQFNLGRKDEALATLEQFAQVHPEENRGLFTCIEAIVAASNGDERIAEEKIRSALEMGHGFGHFHHTAYLVGCAFALMHKGEPAIRWLENAADDGFPCYPLFLNDRNLDNLRDDPRFIALLEKLKQQWDYHRSIL